MKRTFSPLLLLLCFSFQISHAQNDWIKLDVPRLFFKDINVSYEHVIQSQVEWCHSGEMFNFPLT